MDRMTQLVGSTVEIAQDGHLALAERRFEQRLQQARESEGPGSGLEADLLCSFAVLLFVEGRMNDRADMAERAPLYIDRAVAAARTAWGPRHPELATLLHTKADILAELAGESGAAPPAAEAALREAYEIRVGALGTKHLETIAAVRQLAILKARSPSKADEAAALFNQAIDSASGLDLDDHYLREPSLRLQLARLLAEADRPKEAVREAREGAEAAAGGFLARLRRLLPMTSVSSECYLYGREVDGVVTALRKKRRFREAQEVSAFFEAEWCE